MTSLAPLLGLLPAGGQATRIAPLPCSKELYPIGFRGAGDALRPKAICHYLLESMRAGGVERIFVVLRPGKWDIPAYLGDGTLVGIPIGYLMMGVPYGSPYTLDQAYPFVRGARIAMGFPDILFEPADAFVQLVERQAATQADIVLGLFPTDRPDKADMVDVDQQGAIRTILVKPGASELPYTWILAVWSPEFTEFLHQFIADRLRDMPTGELAGRELYMGHVILAALAAGLRAETVAFPQGRYLDIGTPDDLLRAVRSTL